MSLGGLGRGRGRPCTAGASRVCPAASFRGDAGGRVARGGSSAGPCLELLGSTRARGAGGVGWAGRVLKWFRSVVGRWVLECGAL